MKLDKKYSKNCKQCGKLFHKNYNVSKNEWFGCERRPKGVLFCSKKCLSKNKEGFIPWNKGKKGVYKWSEEQKEKVSFLWHIKREKNTNFKVSGSKWQSLKKIVLKRDGFTCQCCFLYDEEILQVDHIIPKSIRQDLYYRIENCITLCPNCHAYKTKKDRVLIYNFKKNGKF